MDQYSSVVLRFFQALNVVIPPEHWETPPGYHSLCLDLTRPKCPFEFIQNILLYLCKAQLKRALKKAQNTYLKMAEKVLSIPSMDQPAANQSQGTAKPKLYILDYGAGNVRRCVG